MTHALQLVRNEKSLDQNDKNSSLSMLLIPLSKYNIRHNFLT